MNEKVLNLIEDGRFKGQQFPLYITNNPTNEKEVDEKMSGNNFTTEKDLENFEEKINLKIKVAVQPLEGKIDNLQTEMKGKFETLEQKIENMFLSQMISIQKERKENIKWIIGTGLAVVSIIIAFFFNK